MQAFAEPMPYHLATPATGTMRLILFCTRIKFSFQTTSLIIKTQFAAPLPNFMRFENPNRRDDAGDQFRRRHVETRITRATGRIRHANVFTLLA